MTSRILLSAVLASVAARRKRRSDGAVFAVCKVRDSDRGSPRFWTVFANDLTVIEMLEGIRVGEPIAIAGPFSVVGERDLEYRISAESVIDTKRRKKPKGLIAKESRIESDELDLAPHELDDEIPFGGPA
jgi:hypothetical protein